MSFQSKFVWIALLLGAAWLVSACTVHPALRPAQPAVTPADVMDSTAAAADNLRSIVAAQLRVPSEAVAVVAVEAVEWPDACLGAAGPDEMCAQVVTPGYRITLAVAGQEYIYHTDQSAHWSRLVEGPAVDVGAPVIVASVTVDNGACQDVVVGADGIAFGYCGGALMGGKFVSPARRATLAEFMARYAAFETVTDLGTIAFYGSGDSAANDDEKRQLAAWLQRLTMEAASGAAMGGLAWNGPGAMASGDTSKCATLAVGGSAATVFDCAGNARSSDLDGGLLATWLYFQDRFAPFVLDTPTEHLDFTGMGVEADAVWQRALLAWARTQYAQLGTGQVSAAGSTVLAWDLGATDATTASCMHLTVLAWGEVYAETRPCAGGDVESLETGWLTTAEMEQLDTWLSQYAPLYAEQGYVAGAGDQPADAALSAAVDQWAEAVWLRIRSVTTASGVVAACPVPDGDRQLLVMAEDGYCLLYPAAYVAEQTAPGNTSVVLGSLMNHVDPRVGIEVTDGAGRTLTAIGDQLMAGYASGFDVLRGTTKVGGEDALVLDNLPGQDFNRRVAVLHNGRLYSFFFTPLGETDEARAAMAAFYRGILNSFTFLE